MEKFKDKIRVLRQKRNITQQQLADDLKVSKQAVSKWEKGHSLPDVTSVEMIASYFGVSTDYLLNDEAEIEVSARKTGLWGAVIAKEKVIMRILVCALLAAVVALSVILGVTISRNRIPETVNVNGWEVTYSESQSNYYGSFGTFCFYIYNTTDFSKTYHSECFSVDNEDCTVYFWGGGWVEPKNGDYVKVSVSIKNEEAENKSFTLYFYGHPVFKFKF